MAKNIPMGKKIYHFAHCPYQEIHNYLNMKIPDYQGRKLRLETGKDGEKGWEMAVKSINSKVKDFSFQLYIPH